MGLEEAVLGCPGEGDKARGSRGQPMGRECVCWAMVDYTMCGREQRAPCRLGREWGVTHWSQMGEVKGMGVGCAGVG